MFYEPKDGHGLSKNPFNSLVVPRPIGWISSVDGAGNVNLAPYSFFNAVAYNPPTVMFSAGHGQVEDDSKKDSLRNIVETGEFVHNVTTWDTREAMNESSATTAKDVDEMAMAGLTPIPSTLVKPPRVKEAPIHFECKLLQTVDLPNTSGGNTYTVVFGEVIGIHIEDEFILPSGQIDIAKLHPIGRMGYQDYTEVTGETVFTMDRPGFRE
ncbi:MAG: flavin reductase family protein [Alphaproteobacteria bacterium]|nr:flavin reductase family protein [Alphaproteobacteria bacterium]